MDAIERLKRQIHEAKPSVYTLDRISYMTYPNLVYALRKLEYEKRITNGS